MKLSQNNLLIQQIFLELLACHTLCASPCIYLTKSFRLSLTESDL